MQNTTPLKRTIILGHTGFIGGNLFQRLRKTNLIETLGYSSSDIDLTNESHTNKLSELFDENTAVIFLSANKRQLGDNLDSFKKNMTMIDHFCRLIENHPIGRLIYFSSAAVYGEDVEHSAIQEDTAVCPTSFYGIGKFTAERMLWKTISSQNSSSYIFLRPPTIYGPGDNLFPYGPSGFTKSAVNNNPITLWGDGTELREFIYIDDVVEIVERLIFKDFQGVLNLAAGKSYNFVDVLDCLREYSKQEIEINSKPRSKQKVDQYFANDLLRSLFPDFEFTGLNKGIKLLYEYLSR